MIEPRTAQTKKLVSYLIGAGMTLGIAPAEAIIIHTQPGTVAVDTDINNSNFNALQQINIQLDPSNVGLLGTASQSGPAPSAPVANSLALRPGDTYKSGFKGPHLTGSPSAKTGANVAISQSALSFGSVIGPGTGWAIGSPTLNKGASYYGLRLSLNGGKDGYHYGWLHYNTGSITLTDVAIQLNDNQTITVGEIERREPPTTVPEPATLVLLAGGFAGLGVYRRRRRSLNA